MAEKKRFQRREKRARGRCSGGPKPHRQKGQAEGRGYFGGQPSRDE